MPTPQKPVRRRSDVVEAELSGGLEKRELVIEDYDHRWPEKFLRHEQRIRRSPGALAVSIEHMGSTSVPGLAAKPIIDILVTVADITAEEDYIAPLVAAGYELRVREPDHRMVRTAARDVHVHILEPDDPAGHDLCSCGITCARTRRIEYFTRTQSVSLPLANGRT